MIIMGEGKYIKMHIERGVNLFNTACNIVHTMKQKGMPNEELFALIDYMRTVAMCEFPAPKEESPIIVPDTATVAEVTEAK